MSMSIFDCQASTKEVGFWIVINVCCEFLKQLLKNEQTKKRLLSLKSCEI